MHVSFDLDGTLIDSRPSVQDALVQTFSDFGISCDLETIDGQTLEEIISMVGVDEVGLRLEIKEKFSSIYDESLCTQCKLYPDVREAVLSLASRGVTLTLVTNKRLKPTQKILDHLLLTEHFVEIIGSDQMEFGANKFERLRCIYRADCQNFYVGDTVRDREDSEAAGFTFLFASWGYGSFKSKNTLQRLKEIEMFLT